jgi:hypothetical protein
MDAKSNLKPGPESGGLTTAHIKLLYPKKSLKDFVVFVDYYYLRNRLAICFITCIAKYGCE